MSEARARVTPPRWAQRPGESFAAYVERFHGQLESPAARACGEELARQDREAGEPADADVAPSDASER